MVVKELLKSRRSEFTTTEDRLIELITKGLNKVLQDAWNDLTPTTITYQNREINPQFASFVDANDLVLYAPLLFNYPILMLPVLISFILCKY